MNLLIRADASRSIGTGHIMRCMAIAEAWSLNEQALAGGRITGGSADTRKSCVTFVVSTITADLRKRLLTAGYAVKRIRVKAGSKCDAERTAALARQTGAPLVVVDGYQFGSRYQQTLKKMGLLVLSVDDYGHAKHYSADLIVNQNSYATENLYPSINGSSKLLLGTRYLMLRKEFHGRARKLRTTRKRADRILITLGGAAGNRQLVKLVRALGQVREPRLRVRIVLGSTKPSREMTDAILGVAGIGRKHDIRLIQAPCNMRENMEWADLAVSAAGSTLWELIFLGVPTLATILAANQRRGASDLHSRGLVRNLGWLTRLSPETLAQEIRSLLRDAAERESMLRTMSGTVDGKGAARVVSEVNDLIADSLVSPNLATRRATAADSGLLLSWANDPYVRDNSFHSHHIPAAEHREWLSGQLASPNACITIVELMRIPVAQVRFERSGPKATVSISVGAQFRGRGIGAAALNMATSHIRSTWRLARLEARVLTGNSASARLFSRNGYKRVRRVTIEGKECWLFRKRCQSRVRRKK